MKELEKLSDEELDVRLAELCGKHQYFGVLYSGSRCTDCGDGIYEEKHRLPRYTADLNECAKVEAGLTPHQLEDYDKRWLPRVHFASDRDAYWQPRTVESYLWHATARQRTIALIATLEAK